MISDKQKVLEAKAALLNEYPSKRIRYFMGIPFDPTSENKTQYDKKMKRLLNQNIF